MIGVVVGSAAFTLGIYAAAWILGGWQAALAVFLVHVLLSAIGLIVIGLDKPLPPRSW